MKKLLIIIIVIALAGAGGYAYQHNKNDKTKKKSGSSTTQNTNSPSTDPYKGWKIITSSRAGFSIRYPSGWTANLVVGKKDSVEHITIESQQFHITINSYNGKDVSTGGTAVTACGDCLRTVSSTTFSVPNLGSVALRTITYKLDNGQGNALVLELLGNKYYLPSPSRPNVSSSFRGISVLGTEKEYQTESSSQFVAQADYETAKKILESLTY